MGVKKKTRKIARYLFTTLLTIGVIISTGLLSFSGLMLITPSVVLASIAFVLAGVVEGEVFKQNIFQGMSELRLLGQYGYRQLIVKALNQGLERALKREEQSRFLKDYQAQKKYVSDFENKTLNDEQKIAYKKAKKRLHAMEKFFVSCVLATTKNPSVNKADCPECIGEMQAALSAIKRKVWFLRVNMPLCLLSGIGFGFVTASALQSASATLIAAWSLSAASAALATTVLSACIWPLAVMACVGYAFLIYHTLSDMVCHETFAKWRRKIKTWFKPDPSEQLKYLKCGLRVAMVTLAVSLGIAATIATAGTWWLAVEQGAALLPYLVTAASHIRNVLVPLIGITGLVFNVKNSLDSVKQIIQRAKQCHLPRPAEWIRNKISKIKMNPWKSINVPHMLAKVVFLPCQFFIFIGHLAATGFTTDRVGDVPPVVTATVSAASEGFQDLHYLMGEDHHTASHGHDHQHGNILEWTLKAVLSPLLFLAAVWDYCASNRKGKYDESSEQAPMITFKEALKKSFGMKKSQPAYQADEMPSISVVWQKQEMMMRFAKEKKRLSHVKVGRSLARQKIAVLDQLVEEQPPVPSSPVVTNVLDAHRFFKPKQTATRKFVEQMREDYPTILRMA